MSFRNAVRRMAKIITGTSILTISFLLTVAAQPGSQVQQGLVAGAPVSNEIQQKMGLVSLSSGCSGALIRQNWVLTAAHCIDTPNGAGGFTTMAAANLMVKLNGTGLNPQLRQAEEIVSFRPDDVAIVRVQPAFNGSDFNNREIYTGDMTNMTIRLFGRGIDEFSKDGNPSKGNDQYRDGFVDVISKTASTYTFNARGGVMVAGGDSGGPSFVKGHSSSAFGATDMIAGVHSLCMANCARGKTCGGAADPWEWVTSTPTCTDASIAPLWPKILKLLEPAFPNQTFDTNFKGDEFNILYTVSQDGGLTWHRHVIRYPGGNKNATATHSFNEPKTVGNGWAGGVKAVMPMGQLGIYSFTDDGTLRSNWHLGFADGTYNWREPVELRKGLTGFSDLVAQDEGVIYARLQGDPGILWGFTKNYDAKKGTPSTSFTLRLTAQNIHFGAFRTMFAGGKGVLYGIGYDGKLYWMKHNFYLSPIPDPATKIPQDPQFHVWVKQWSGPVEIGSGFNGVTQAFSPGDGHIYYVSSGGALVWRRHLGWEKGTNTWQDVNWNVIANGWGNYKFVFARNTSSDLGSGNPLLEVIVK